MSLKRIFSLLLLLVVVLSFQKSEENIRRFNQPAMFEKVQKVIPHQIEFNDTIPGDTLLEYVDDSGLPLIYCRKIITGVCIDGKCRLVNINLFWHIVYGNTKREIENLTNKNLTPKLGLRLLESTVLKDKIWALNHISEEIEIMPEMKEKIFEFIGGEDVYLTERALNALKPATLSEKEIQQKLAEIFSDAGYLQKRLILKRLEQAPVIHSETAEKPAEEIKNLRGALVRTAISLFEKHDIENREVISEITGLLQNENRFIANEAVQYLEQLEEPGKKTQRKLDKYKKKYNLN